MTIASADLRSLISKVPLFEVLDSASLALVADRLRPISFVPGQLIFSRGDRGREMYLVLEGRIRLSILTIEGRELSLAHATTGQLFGEIAALDGKARTADATALTNVKAMVLSANALFDVLQSHPEVASSVITFLCSRLRETDDKLEAIALHPIETRLARFLLSALNFQAKGTAKPVKTLDLAMSQTELGLLIGASRPKVNAALVLLEERGAFKRSGGSLDCDLDILREIAAAD